MAGIRSKRKWRKALAELKKLGPPRRKSEAELKRERREAYQQARARDNA